MEVLLYEHPAKPYGTRCGGVLKHLCVEEKDDLYADQD